MDFFVHLWLRLDVCSRILIGRGTAPVQFDIEKLQKELASLKEAVIKKEELRFKIDPDTAGPKRIWVFTMSSKRPNNPQNLCRKQRTQ